MEEPAVVIIDEIDLHLHPKWQRELKEILIRHFPHTQFICTAHSPFMAQSSEDENLAVLQRDRSKNNQVRIENDPLIVKGWRIGQIITSDLFGVESERSPEVENDINRRRTLLDQQSFSELSEEEKKELTELDKKLSELPIQFVGSDDNLRLIEKFNNLSKML
ncbi:MAG: AAA family ATPase [Segetibacter sp.]